MDYSPDKYYETHRILGGKRDCTQTKPFLRRTFLRRDSVKWDGELF
jgi:hypothetical protein